MGSSKKGTNLQTPPTGPSPPADQIHDVGGTPVNPHPFVNFLDPGMGMSTGFNPRIEGDLARGYSIPPGGMPMPVTPGAASPAAAAAMTIPKLSAPPEGSMRGWFQQAAQGVADSANKANNLESYLQGREQLAKLMQMGRFRRGQGSGGDLFTGDRGGGYGSSGRGSGGGTF